MDLTVVVDGQDRHLDTVYNNDVYPEGRLQDATTFGGTDFVDGRVRKFTVTVKRGYEGFEAPGHHATIIRPDGQSFEVSIVGLDLHHLPEGKKVRLSVRDKKIEGFLAGR